MNASFSHAELTGVMALSYLMLTDAGEGCSYGNTVVYTPWGVLIMTSPAMMRDTGLTSSTIRVGDGFG